MVWSILVTVPRPPFLSKWGPTVFILMLADCRAPPWAHPHRHIMCVTVSPHNHFQHSVIVNGTRNFTAPSVDCTVDPSLSSAPSFRRNVTTRWSCGVYKGQHTRCPTGPTPLTPSWGVEWFRGRREQLQAQGFGFTLDLADDMLLTPPFNWTRFEEEEAANEARWQATQAEGPVSEVQAQDGGASSGRRRRRLLQRPDPFTCQEEFDYSY